MKLTRAERFRLKGRLVDVISENYDDAWSISRQNMLLGEFKLGPVSTDWNDPGFDEEIANIPDDDLIEMCAIVTGQDVREVEESVETVDSENWKPGYVRLFLSHSAAHKEFVGRIADELAIVGIHGFVAHDTMTVSKPWAMQIEHALRSMQAFVAIVHPEFNPSAWCHQEVGWALGRRVPRFVVRMGADPAGFVGMDQWPSEASSTAKQVAAKISGWASSVPDLGATMTDGLFAALDSAGNYMDAGATAERIAALSGLTEDQWKRLDEIYWHNDQIHGGALPTRALRPFYQHHLREWPPPKPAGPQPDPWVTESDEPPF